MNDQINFDPAKTGSPRRPERFGSFDAVTKYSDRIRKSFVFPEYHPCSISNGIHGLGGRHSFLRETFVAMIIREYARQLGGLSGKQYGMVIPANENDAQCKDVHFFWVFPFGGRDRLVAVDVAPLSGSKKLFPVSDFSDFQNYFWKIKNGRWVAIVDRLSVGMSDSFYEKMYDRLAAAVGSNYPSIANPYLSSAMGAFSDVQRIAEARKTDYDALLIQYDDRLPPMRSAILDHAARLLAWIVEAEECIKPHP